MKQLYALISHPISEKLAEKFPNAIDVGAQKLAPFVDEDSDKIALLGNLDILTYEQAKELVNKECKDELDI